MRAYDWAVPVLYPSALADEDIVDRSRGSPDVAYREHGTVAVRVALRPHARPEPFPAEANVGGGRNHDRHKRPGAL
jgi:hypothetical protein